MRALHIFSVILFSSLISSCSPSAFIGKAAGKDLINSGDLANAQVGILIYNDDEKKDLFHYQSNKYFVPASNTKLFTCYAAMKFLDDSITGIYYASDDTALYLVPAADPTFLHRDFKKHPLFDMLMATNKKIYITDENWRDNALGYGWSWDDYNDNYMAERSPMPMYGNVTRWVQDTDTSLTNTNGVDHQVSIYSIPEVNWKVRFNPEPGKKVFAVNRKRDENYYLITEGVEAHKEQDVPFVTNGLQSSLELLPDTLGKGISILHFQPSKNNRYSALHSQALDSMLRPMMYRSDNFFAEQTLLMVSQKILGYMNAGSVIDTLLKTSLSDLPQKPKWVDGSGLSRYNLFSPEDMVSVLKKMKDEFGMDRLKQILPSGGKGTLSNFFKSDGAVILAKTGTLSNHLALSGFLYTRKNKLLLFSVMVNNHNGSASAIRRQIEGFLQAVRKKY